MVSQSEPTATAILDAAERLLGRYGYKKMTVDDLAHEAGIGKGTVYLYFRSKEEVVLSTVDRIVDRVCLRLEEIAASGRSAALRLHDMLVARVMIRFDAVRDYAQGLNDLLSEIRSALLARRRAYFAREARIFQRVIEEGIRTGELTRDAAPRTARALLTATNALLPYSLSARELGDRRTIERQVLDVAELLVEGAVKRSRSSIKKEKPMKQLAVVTLLAICLIVPLQAQGPGPGNNQPDMTLDAATRSAVIDGALKNLEEAYVFPEVAKKMTDSIRGRVKQKEYDSVTSAKELATKLTTDLRAVSKDKHLTVRYSHKPIPKNDVDAAPTAEQQQAKEAFLKRTNFGFEKVQRLPGNVGYLEMRGFVEAAKGGAVASAAMNLLANADALIIDLRRNGGGSPDMVAFVSSYLFDGPDPVHLNSIYSREGDTTQQWWTNPFVPGAKFGGSKPVYVLTSNKTFSAAEEFTYNLQTQKRATIIGETTGGGAHPGGPRRINDNFEVWFPAAARSIRSRRRTGKERVSSRMLRSRHRKR